MPVPVREINLKPGLSVHIIDTCVENCLRVQYEHITNPVTFGFFFSGKGKNCISNDSGKKILFSGNQGDCGISYFPKSSGTCEYTSQKRLQMVHISVDHFLLDHLMTGGQEKIDPDFYPVLSQNSKNYHNKSKLSYSIQTALAQLLCCPFHGSIKNIYLESKVLELVALQLDRLIFDYSGSAPKSPEKDEIERIYEARDIVLHSHMNPPSLGELSRLVGLNEFKLKRGFKNIFGNTVFGCLYEHRMELARLHIEEGKKSVKEIAYAVGYQSVSRFSDAFKRKFGVRPTRYSL